MSKRFAHWVVSHPFIIILFTLIIVLPFSAGLKNWHMSADFKAFIKDDNVYLKRHIDFKETFGSTHGFLIVVAPKNEDIFTKRNLILIERLNEIGWMLPYSIRVDSITNFSHTTVDGDDMNISPLIKDINALSERDIVGIKSIALNESALVGNLLSDKGHVAAVNISFAFPDDSSRGKSKIIMDDFRDKYYEQLKIDYPDVTFYLSGSVGMDLAFKTAPKEDGKLIGPLSGLVLFSVLFLILRNIWASIVSGLIIGLSAASGMGAIVWTGVELTAIASSTIAIILVLCIADCIHILVNFFQEYDEGISKRDAMINSISMNTLPVILTSVTTAISFLSLNFSDVPPYHVLGNMVAASAIFAMILSLTLLPNLILWLPAKQRTKKSRNLPTINWLAKLVIQYPMRVFIVIACLIVSLSSQIVNVEPGDNPFHFFSEKVPFRQATNFIQKELTGLRMINLSIPVADGEDNSVTDYAYLKMLDDLETILYEDSLVRHVSSFAGIMKRLNRSMHNNEEAWYRVPEDTELAAQYLLLFNMTVPAGLDTSNVVTADERVTKMVVKLRESTDLEVIRLENKIVDWFEKNAPEVTPAITSPTLMFAHTSYKNIISLSTGLLYSMGVISIILFAVFRSVKLSVISIVPNLVPALMALGAWSFIDGQMGMGVATALAATFGIVVDDTIHFIVKFRRGYYEKGKSLNDAVYYAFEKVGVAMIITSLVLCAGFAVLTQSNFTPNVDSGLMMGMTIVFAVIVDLTLLPILLMKWGPSSNKSPINK